MNKVAVLLSSYNGEKYIEEQLNSILNQRDVSVEIWIRDDGSTDNTKTIIKELQKNNSNIFLVEGENIGWKKSFMELVYEIAPEADYYAFADQDDFWLEKKLYVGITKIEKQEKATMYYSNLCETDENLNPLGIKGNIRQPNKEEALFMDYVYGCTIIFNNSMMQLLKKYRIKKETAHDFWIGLVSLFLGNIIYDENSYILYRKHKNTATHSGQNFYLEKMKRLLSGKRINNYAIYLLKGYSDILDTEIVCYLEKIAKYNQLLWNKIYAVRKVKKTTLKGTIFLKLCFLFNRMEKMD